MSGIKMTGLVVEVFVSVAICTFNRAESLRRTLESLVRMDVPAEVNWEVVVVNNNSTDHTDSVITDFMTRLPIRREFEPRQGQSYARNRAVEVAMGDYIIWTDDDVVVDVNWLHAYVVAFSCHAGAAVFGGQIQPRYETPVEKWVTEGEVLLGGPYALRNFGDDPVPLCSAARRLPYGANYAVRTAEQRKFLYDPELGLGPGRRGAGEEIDMVDRLLRSGAIGYWVPAARVEHCIGRNRQTIQYIMRHFVGAGETDAFLQRHTGLAWFGVPRWMFRRLVQEWFYYRIHRLISRPTVWLPHLRDYAYTFGAVCYYLRITRR